MSEHHLGHAAGADIDPGTHSNDDEQMAADDDRLDADAAMPAIVVDIHFLVTYEQG
jgi:hypothetical protein